MITVMVEVIDIHSETVYELGVKYFPVWPDRDDVITIDGKEYRVIMYRMWEVGAQSPEIILRVKPNWISGG